MARKLRIAVSVFFRVLTVALCVLWVRSYSTIDIYQRVEPNNNTLTITSLNGEVAASSRKWPNAVRSRELVLPI
jgi:hypothetical protein